MASFLVKGLHGDDVKIFQSRCKLAGVHPGEILSAFLRNADPKEDEDTGDTVLSFVIRVHHKTPVCQ